MYATYETQGETTNRTSHANNVLKARKLISPKFFNSVRARRRAITVCAIGKSRLYERRLRARWVYNTVQPRCSSLRRDYRLFPCCWGTRKKKKKKNQSIREIDSIVIRYRNPFTPQTSLSYTHTHLGPMACLIICVNKRPLDTGQALELHLQGLTNVMRFTQGHVSGEDDVDLDKEILTRMVGAGRVYLEHLGVMSESCRKMEELNLIF